MPNPQPTPPSEGVGRERLTRKERHEAREKGLEAYRKHRMAGKQHDEAVNLTLEELREEYGADWAKLFEVIKMIMTLLALFA